MKTSTIGALELTILLTVARLGSEAYGLSVQRDLAQRMRRDYSVGAIYTTLERLERKGFVVSRVTDPTPTRGGRSRRQFKVTSAGHAAIRTAERFTKSVWAGVGTSINPEPA